MIHINYIFRFSPVYTIVKWFSYPLYTSWIFSAIMTVGSFLYQRKRQKEMEAKQRQAAEAAKDRAATKLVRVSGSNQPILIAYGYNRVGGTNVFTDVSSSFSSAAANANEEIFGSLSSFSGSKNETLITQAVICADEVDDIVWVEINDEDHDNSDYGGWAKLYINKKGGLISNSSTLSREASAVFNDVCYSTSFFRMNRDEPQFSGKPSTSFYLKGRKIRTFDGSGVLSTTATFSNNAIEVLLDYFTEQPFGPKISDTELDLTTFATAAALSGEAPRGSVAVNGKVYDKAGVSSRSLLRHEFNGVLKPDSDHVANIESILEGVPGLIIYRSIEGQLKVSLPDTSLTEASASVGEVTDSLLGSDIDYQIPDTNDKLNAVSLSYVNSGKDFAEDTYEFDSSSLLANDHGIKLSSSVSPAGVSNVYQAEAIAKATVNESRLASFTFTINLGSLGNGRSSLELEPGDVIHLNSHRNKIDTYVRISAIDITPDMALKIDALAYTAEAYEFNSVEVETPQLRTSVDMSVTPPSNVDIESITDPDSLYNTIKVTWTDADDVQVYEYLVQAGTVQADASIVWGTAGVVPFGTEIFEHFPNQVATYKYRVRGRTRLGRMSPWVTSASGGYIGKQQILGGFSIQVSRSNFMVKKSLADGTITPTSDTSEIQLWSGGVLSTLSTGAGDVLAGEWRITSAASGDVDGVAWSSVLTSDKATYTLNFSAALTSAIVPVTLVYNGTIDGLPLGDAGLSTFEKSFYVEALSDGVMGEDGAAGVRGAGWHRFVTLNTQVELDALTSGALSIEFQNGFGSAPVAFDRMILSGIDGAVKAWVFDGSTWSSQAEVIDGNLLVAGTVNADSLSVVNTASGFQASIDENGLVLRSADAGNARLEILENVIKVFDDNNVLRVKIGDLSA